MASTKDRIIAGTGAAVFFLSIIALTVTVLVTMAQENKQKKEAANPAAANAQPQEGKLQGTKLAGFEPVENVPELQTIDLQEGTGKAIESPDEKVTADYTGAVAKDGTIFESSLDSGQPLNMQLNQVIEGWQKGMIGMKEGGKRRLVIPAEQAYGANPPQGSPIPANAALVFDITLKKVGE